MALKANAVMTFTDYQITDTGVQGHFVCLDPGGGEVSDYYVFLTDAELTATANLAALASLVTTKMQRRYRATGLAAKLDPLIGQTITI